MSLNDFGDGRRMVRAMDDIILNAADLQIGTNDTYSPNGPVIGNINTPSQFNASAFLFNGNPQTFPVTGTQYTASAPVVASDANALIINNSLNTIEMENADATHPGIVSTAAQTFAGLKTFGNGINSTVGTFSVAIATGTGNFTGPVLCQNVSASNTISAATSVSSPALVASSSLTLPGPVIGGAVNTITEYVQYTNAALVPDAGSPTNFPYTLTITVINKHATLTLETNNGGGYVFNGNGNPFTFTNAVPAQLIPNLQPGAQSLNACFVVNAGGYDSALLYVNNTGNINIYELQTYPGATNGFNNLNTYVLGPLSVSYTIA